jgi:hypothetical protein
MERWFLAPVVVEVDDDLTNVVRVTVCDDNLIPLNEEAIKKQLLDGSWHEYCDKDGNAVKCKTKRDAFDKVLDNGEVWPGWDFGW